MAEAAGFEPAERGKPFETLAKFRHRPLAHASIDIGYLVNPFYQIAKFPGFDRLFGSRPGNNLCETDVIIYHIRFFKVCQGS